jgi:mannan endo-1,4-beta-mannosidase
MKKIIILPVLYSILIIYGCSEKSTVTPSSMPVKEKRDRLLAYIQDLPNRDSSRVISGQQCGNTQTLPADYNKYIRGLYDQTGKWCALIGVDFNRVDAANYRSANAVIIDHWNKGGLVTVSFHSDNPWTGGDSWDTDQADLTDLVDESTEAHKVFKVALDNAVVALKHLQSAGVVVLWRPFHEMNGNWFWWGMGAHPDDPQPFGDLWCWIYSYMVKSNGLDNLIWVYSANREGDPAWSRSLDYYYPGPDYVDMVGVDVYADIIDIQNYQALQSLQKPIALTEFGPGTPQEGGGDYDQLRIIYTIRSKYPDIVYWLSWGDWTSNGEGVYKSIVNNRNAQALLEEPWVITREEVDWKSVQKN